MNDNWSDHGNATEIHIFEGWSQLLFSNMFNMSSFVGVIRFCPALFVFALGCIEPYDPPVVEKVLNTIVVEGFINATRRSASVKLSHLVTVYDTNEPRPESKAKIFIQSSTGDIHNLIEQDSGIYSVYDLVINKDAVYTLHVKTMSGAEYASDTIRVMDTPPIDSLNFGISGDGQSLTVTVTTHDPLNKARYYKWDYVETYRYNAPFYSGFHYINRTLIYRKQEEQIYACWRTEPSPTISIGTSSGLSQGIINRHVLTYLPRESPKISVRYSILVRQMAISKPEYEYLGQLKNTTENLGSIFGIMPTSVTGNIHQVDDVQAPVLGYFSGAEVTEKRFFIERLEMPEYFRVAPSKEGCEALVACTPLRPPGPFYEFVVCVPGEAVSSDAIVLSAEGDGHPAYFFYTTPECGDCRTQGGTTIRPEFW